MRFCILVDKDLCQHNNYHLTTYLAQRDCHRRLDWYKALNETTGSVEKTSFGKLKSINELGVYEIGSSRSKQVVSKDDAVCLRLRKPEDGTTLPIRRYSIDALKDLESKLVLITGANSKEKEAVQLFLNVCIHV